MNPPTPPMTRIVHTADWHLGKMLNEQSREVEQKLFLDWLLKQVAELEVTHKH